MTALNGLPAPTAIEPSRVLILDEAQQRDLYDALLDGMAESPSQAHADQYGRLRDLLAYGEEYNDAADELTRVTLRKRRLEAEIRRCNAQIEALDDTVTEEWADRGISGLKHTATGSSLYLDSKAYVKLDVDTGGMSKEQAADARAAVKAAAGQAMRQDPELSPFVREDFNLNTLSAYFREQIKAAREAEKTKPEHERRPVVANDFIPESLRGLLRIDEKPTIQVRASGS